jgi:hypothetical protein
MDVGLNLSFSDLHLIPSLVPRFVAAAMGCDLILHSQLRSNGS